MRKAVFKRILALLMAAVLCFGVASPLVAQALDQTKLYYDFLDNLKVLEGYADSYVMANSGDPKELVINYIRTGVDRYTEGNWVTLAGEEKKAFTAYVAKQDADNGTNAAALRDLELFYLPNGDQVDFGHMFGTLNIAYINAQASGDLGGWAGDICDLMLYSKSYGYVPEGTVDEKAAFILKNCFGVDAGDAFGMDDFYGDMDAFYLIKMIKGTNAKLSTVAEAYFTSTLSNENRAEFFLKNRFNNLYTRESVRTAVYEAYKGNVGLQVLEADRGLSDDHDLRTACCYAFADYLYNLAGNTLEEPSEGGGNPDDPDNENRLDVYSQTDSVLAPGISQSVVYAFNEKNQQVAYYSSVIDITRDDVHVFANYKDNDPSKGWGMQRLTDQMNAAQAAHSNPLTNNYIENYRPIVGINADFYNMSTGKPSGVLVMEGVTYKGEDKGSDKRSFFGILDDGTPVIGSEAEWSQYADRLEEAVGGSIIFIKDGQFVENASSYYSEPGTRSCVGITADGKVMFLVVDGRQEPFSIGTDLKQTAQIMIDAGCVIALHLDGGGSATYASKPAGSDTVQLVSRPSDGYQRSVSTTLMAISTAQSSNEFEYATITSSHDYLTIGTSLQMNAVGVTNIGGNAPIPAGAAWRVSNSAVGTIDGDGLFTALENGEVEVQLVLDGEVVGSKKLNVVVPDAIAFEKEAFSVVYGVPTKLTVNATYNGNLVATNKYDFELGAEYETVGEFNGQIFTAYEGSGIRKVLCIAFLTVYDELYSICTVNMYHSDEAIFDFDNATAGNHSLAWNRDVDNSITKDNVLYQIAKPGDDMKIHYTFALDMAALEVPEQLADLTYMLPGADAGADAFTLMLQLAERISTLSEVRITAVFDKNLDVDISDIKVVNEYFEMRSAELDPETNTLTLICGWIDQTAAIDPATANPNCILSGIVATPKDGAAWNAEDQLAITNTGDVSYKIYLRANALYQFAQIESNQQKYSLIPFENPNVIINGSTEKGAWFGQTYTTFEDSFVLDSTNRQGWVEEDGVLYYYVNNVALTGLQAVPGYENPAVTTYYTFAEDGRLVGTFTGLMVDGDIVKYAANGVLQKGWQSVMDENGESAFYYFDPYTYAAVNGACKVEGYNYVFEDYKCVRGEIVKTAGGLKYRFAGLWQRFQWIELDGKEYYIDRNYYLVTGCKWVYTKEGSVYEYHMFDENGVFQSDYTGLYEENGDLYYFAAGIRVQEPGLLYLNGYYYYFNSTAKAVKNCTYWISVTNDLLPMGPYQFDAQGRMINPPVTEPPVDPEPPVVEPVKDGIVNEGGALYYYKDGVLQYSAGLVKIGEDYIYVRSNGQLAIGSYWVTNNNGLLPQGIYTFGADGKMIVATDPDPDPEQPEQPPVKDGIVNENGILYYYKNNVRQYCAGLIIIDGDYYYVRSNAQLAIGKYWATNHNNLLPAQEYTFGADGKMLNPPTATPDKPPVEPEQPVVKDGIVAENGGYFYYIDGKLAYCAGVIQLEDGAYIYVRSNGQLATGIYWPTHTNGLIPAKGYDWGADGKLYL